jgi:murein DD-endopeptidase MepM/ murein hydrolase activator NlpD
MGEFRRRLREVIDRLFPERQFYYRSEGVVRFVTLGRRSQMALSAVLVGIFGWMTFATVQVVWLDQILEAKDRRAAEVTTAYYSLARRAYDAERRFLEITGEVESQHAQLLQLMDYRNNLEAQLGQVSGELEQTSLERGRALGMADDLRLRLTSLQAALETAGAVNRTLASSLADAEHVGHSLLAQREQAISVQRGLMREVADLTDTLHDSSRTETGLRISLDATRSKLAEVTLQREEVLARNESLNQQMADLSDQAETSARRASALMENLSSTQQQLATLDTARDEAVRSRDFLVQLVDKLEYRLADLKDSQGDLVLRLQERAAQSAAEVERILAMTGLPVNDVLAAGGDGAPGIGGPPASVYALGADGAIGPETAERLDAVSAVELQLDRWSALESVLSVLPLVAPSDSYYVSSNFGQRRDPFTGRPAMHYGLDLSGPYDSPLRAPAPGVVTKAGYWGSYGRMVEVDHGNGIVSRYGHMNKILVAEGDWVDFRQDIGTMGRSGRATGSHVHFEVMFSGTPVDPANFLKAGRYVFKNGE